MFLCGVRQEGLALEIEVGCHDLSRVSVHFSPFSAGKNTKKAYVGFKESQYEFGSRL